MTSSARTWIHKFLLFFVSFFFCIVAAESFSRIVLEPRLDQKLKLILDDLNEGTPAEELLDKLGDATNLNLHSPKYPHPFFGYTRPLTKENQSLETLTYGFVERPELWKLEKQPDTLYVGIFGGSVATQAHFHEEKNSVFKKTIQKYLKKPKKIRVLNFAYSGYRQPQQFVIASFFLDKLDVSINIEGVNEAEPRTSPVYPPYYPTSLVSHLYFTQDLYEIKKQQLSLFSDYLEISHKQKTLKGQTPQFSLIRTILKTQILSHWKRIFATMRDMYKPRAGLWESESREKIKKTNVELWSKFIRQQETMARSLNVTSIYALQPAPYFVEKQLSADELGFLAKVTPDTLNERKTNYMLLHAEARQLQQAGLPIYDLASIFKETAESAFRDDCCHLNALGNTLLLEYLARLTAEKINRK
jgi:hypothetical protein